MQVSDPIGEGWQIYRRFWRHLIPVSFAIYIVVAVVSFVLSSAIGLLGSIVNLVGIFLLQASLIEAVADVRDGRADLSLGETINRAWSRVWVAVGAGILAAIAIVFGIVLFIVPGLFLLTIWCLLLQVIVLEGVSVRGSFGRSRSLVSGHAWTVFGVLLSILVIALLSSLVLDVLLHGAPNTVRVFVIGIAENTLLTPFVAAILTCMYFRLGGTGARASTVVPAGVPGTAYSDQ